MARYTIEDFLDDYVLPLAAIIAIILILAGVAGGVVWIWEQV